MLYPLAPTPSVLLLMHCTVANDQRPRSINNTFHVDIYLPQVSRSFPLRIAYMHPSWRTSWERAAQ